MVLNLILSKYGKFGELELSDISHKFPEWARFGDSTKLGKRLIDPMGFFINYDDGSGLFVDGKDFIDSSKEMYLLNR